MIKSAIVFLIVFFGMALNANAQGLQLGAELTPEHKVYCVNILNLKNRRADLHYKIRACPADGSPCKADWTQQKLRNRGRRSTDLNAFCVVKPKPVNLVVSYEPGLDNDFAETEQALEPQVFEWREQWPGTGCIRRGIYRFAPDRPRGIKMKSGRRRGFRFPSCGWYPNTDPKRPRGKIGLPAGVLGGWVQRRGQCPGPGDEAARGRNTLWVQTHAIDNTDGQCWLSGTFRLGKRFTARTMCPAGKNRYKIVDFTFDRISANTMRVRQGRKRSRRYKRCSDKWIPSARDQRFAEDFGGANKRISFNASMRTRLASGKKSSDKHKRTMDIRIDSWGVLHDLQDFGYSKKQSNGRIGEVTRDSSGRRVGWLVRDGKLVRMRERHTFFEIFSWPLTTDGKDIVCKMRLDQISKKSDGVRQVIGSAGGRIDILSYSWNSETCVRGDAVEERRDKPVTYDVEKCLTKELIKKKGRRYELHVGSKCPHDIAARTYGSLESRVFRLKRLDGAATSKISFDLELGPGETPTEVLETIELRAVRRGAFTSNCANIPKDDWRAERTCFDSLVDRKPVETADAPKGRNLDHCIKPRVLRKPRSKPNKPEFELRIKNTCAEDIVVGAFAPLEGGAVGIVKRLAGQIGTPAIYSYWNIKRSGKKSAREFLETIVFWGVPAKAYAAACPKANWQTESRCLETVRGGENALSEAEKRKLAAVYYLRTRYDASKNADRLAIAELTRAIELDPKADYYAQRGLAHLKMPDNAKNNLLGVNTRKIQAIFDFENALKIDPANRTALYQLLKLGIKSKSVPPIALCENGATPTQVIELCTDVIKQAASNKTLLARAHVKRGKAQNEAAEKIVFSAHTDTVIDPETKKAKFKYDKVTRKPRMMLAAKHRKSAFDDFKAAIKADPDSPWGYYELGDMWRWQAKSDKTNDRTRKYKIAIGLYLRALKFAPKNYKICLSLSRAIANSELPNKPNLKGRCP
ncbi:MAG: hypothetical protein AAF441_16610 [Pseudomonadota bacterium]